MSWRIVSIFSWVVVLLLLVSQVAFASAHTAALDGLIELFNANIEGFSVYLEEL